MKHYMERLLFCNVWHKVFTLKFIDFHIFQACHFRIKIRFRWNFHHAYSWQTSKTYCLIFHYSDKKKNCEKQTFSILTNFAIFPKTFFFFFHASPGYQINSSNFLKKEKTQILKKVILFRIWKKKNFTKLDRGFVYHNFLLYLIECIRNEKQARQFSFWKSSKLVFLHKGREAERKWLTSSKS